MTRAKQCGLEQQQGPEQITLAVRDQQARLVSHSLEYNMDVYPILAYVRRLLLLDQKTPILLPKERPDLEPALNPILVDDRHLLQHVCVLTILADKINPTCLSIPSSPWSALSLYSPQYPC